MLLEPFLNDLRKKLVSSFWIDYKNEKFFQNYLEKHSNFIFFFLKYIDFFIKFDSIITPSLWYMQDKAFEKASFKLNKKYFILHKENSFDERDFGTVLKIYLSQLNEFQDNCYVSVYNQSMRKLILETKTFKPENIICSGCPRIDKLVNLSKNNFIKKINQNKTVIFASFSYNLGVYILDKKKNLKRGSAFEAHDSKIVDFFNHVHLEYIDIAAKNKKFNFIIKLKYKHIWQNKILKLIRLKETQLGFKINNLTIADENISISSILPQCRLLIGLNSLTLVEAKILSLPIISPIFPEIEKYEEFFLFTKYYNDVIKISRSAHEFRLQIENNLNNEIKHDFNNKTKQFIIDFFGYTDGKNSERCIKFLLN